MPASFPLGKDVHGLNGAQPATPTWSLLSTDTCPSVGDTPATSPLMAQHGPLAQMETFQPRPHGATWATCPVGDTPSCPLVTQLGAPQLFLFGIFYFHLPGGPTLHSKWIDVAEIFFWAVLYPCAKCPPLGGRNPSHVSGVQGGLCTQRNWQGYQSTVAHSHATLSQQVRMP